MVTVPQHLLKGANMGTHAVRKMELRPPQRSDNRHLPLSCLTKTPFTVNPVAVGMSSPQNPTSTFDERLERIAKLPSDFVRRVNNTAAVAKDFRLHSARMLEDSFNHWMHMQPHATYKQKLDLVRKANALLDSVDVTPALENGQPARLAVDTGNDHTTGRFVLVHRTDGKRTKPFSAHELPNFTLTAKPHPSPEEAHAPSRTR